MVNGGSPEKLSFEEGRPQLSEKPRIAEGGRPGVKRWRQTEQTRHRPHGWKAGMRSAQLEDLGSNKWTGALEGFCTYRICMEIGVVTVYRVYIN